MQFTKGNAAIRDHANRGEDLLLFRDCGRGSVCFVGRMVYAGHEFRIAPDRSGRQRRTILFRLAPAGDFSDPRGTSDAEQAELAAADSMSVEELRRRATEDSQARPDRRERRAAYMRRSEWVRRYAIRRAAGRCAGCDSPAPFSTADGRPYLEIHHTRRLSDGGPDDPDAVIAVCPNCHRRAHFADDAEAFNARLRSLAAAE